MMSEIKQFHPKLRALLDDLRHRRQQAEQDKGQAMSHDWHAQAEGEEEAYAAAFTLVHDLEREFVRIFFRSGVPLLKLTPDAYGLLARSVDEGHFMFSFSDVMGQKWQIKMNKAQAQQIAADYLRLEGRLNLVDEMEVTGE